ncbi:MAG: response regulator [Robiginitomaculum sp.]|nr:response regulator [Robiginitomaculum sp.]
MSQLLHKIANSTFLIVDDQQFLCSVLADLMRGFGAYNSHQAKNGAHAIEMMGSLKPDIVFTDLNMEPVNGFELTQWVRRSPESPDREVPIIMLTGNSDLDTIHKARNYGVTEMLIKPVIPKQVLARLHTVLLEPREFINEKTYVGPCRRRHNDETYKGPRRRACDPMQIQATTEAATKAAEKIRSLVFSLVSTITKINPKNANHLQQFSASIVSMKKLAIKSDNANAAKAVLSLETCVQSLKQGQNIPLTLLRDHLECIVVLSGPVGKNETASTELITNLRSSVASTTANTKVA